MCFNVLYDSIVVTDLWSSRCFLSGNLTTHKLYGVIMFWLSLLVFILIFLCTVFWLFQSLYFGDMWQEPTVLDRSLQDPFARERSISWALINKAQALLKAAVTLSPLGPSTFDDGPPGQWDNLYTKRSFRLASKLVANATWSSHHAP